MEENNKEQVLGMNEVETYFLIDECGAYIWRMNHEMAKGRIPTEAHSDIQVDIMTVKEIQKFAVNNLMRFGIDPESANDRENGDYWKWYLHWDGWKKELSDEEWNTVNSLMAKRESYENYLPKNTWRD